MAPPKTLNLSAETVETIEAMIAKLPMGDPIPDPRSKEARALTRVSGVSTLDFEQWFKDVHKPSLSADRSNAGSKPDLAPNPPGRKITRTPSVLSDFELYPSYGVGEMSPPPSVGGNFTTNLGMSTRFGTEFPPSPTFSSAINSPPPPPHNELSVITMINTVRQVSGGDFTSLDTLVDYALNAAYRFLDDPDNNRQYREDKANLPEAIIPRLATRLYQFYQTSVRAKANRGEDVKRRELEKENARVRRAAGKGKGLLREADMLNVEFEKKHGTKAASVPRLRHPPARG